MILSHSILRRILFSSALFFSLSFLSSRAQNLVLPSSASDTLRVPGWSVRGSGGGVSGVPEQRVPQGVFENFPNTVSNVEMHFTNYGVYGQHPETGRAGGVWPRGSGDSYVHGGGIWFAAMKYKKGNPDDPKNANRLQKMSVISFNPRTGRSWMVPGRIDEPYQNSVADERPEAVNNYRLYNSREYDPVTGKPTDPDDRENGGVHWPVWDTDPEGTPGENHYFGDYLPYPPNRTRARYPKGPAIISDEDFFSVFKDTDLSRYEMEDNAARGVGYPLGIEFEQRVYSWESGPYRDMIIIRYSIVNRSPDTLYDCWAAPVLDVDIGKLSINERTKAAILNKDSDTLDLGVVWSEPEDRSYGYLGYDILESPAVDPNGFIRKDKAYYSQREQLGLATLRNWVAEIDPETPEERYDFMAARTLDDDNGPGDKRLLAATGPFTMRPGDTAQVAVALLFAPAVFTDRWGEWEDMAHLIELDRLAQQAYDSMRTTSSVKDVREDRLWFLKGPDLR